MTRPFYRVIACEIAFREISQVAARSRSLLNLEFLPQGLHDRPRTGGLEIQRRIDAVTAGRHEAVLVGYGLCGNLIRGLKARELPLVIPRAHDCITFFLGSKERYRQRSERRPGTYWFTSGWLECLQRRGEKESTANVGFLPSRAGVAEERQAQFARWAEKHGEEAARYLLEATDDWVRHYTHGALIDFDFAARLGLERRVRDICAGRGWEFENVPGDLGLLQRWVDGEWNPEEFLIVRPGEQVVPAHDSRVIMAEPATPEGE